MRPKPGVDRSQRAEEASEHSAPSRSGSSRQEVGGKDAEDQLVRKRTGDPEGLGQLPFLAEPDASRDSRHRLVPVGGLYLEAVQPADPEPVLAQGSQRVFTEPAAAEGRPNREPNMGGTVVHVDLPEQGFTSEFA